MKVCLIHPDHQNSMDSRLDPPLGLLYIAAALQKHGVGVSVSDLSGISAGTMQYMSIDNSIHTVGKDKWLLPIADIYGITAYVSSLNEVKRIETQCREINPDCKVVIGGAHATACPEDFPYADKVIQGYGENQFCQYVLDPDMERGFFGYHKMVLDLFPAYDLVDINSYHRKIDGMKSLPLITSRGCPYKCAFCGLASMHKRNGGVMTATPEQVYRQLGQIYDLGIRALNIQDDIFTLNRKRLKEILKMIKEYGFKFRCMGRAGYDTEETYAMLADAGCVQVAWGIESGSQMMLDWMNKEVKVQDNYNVIQWAKKYSITSRAFFIIGFPSETKQTLESTKRFIEQAEPDQVFVSNFIPYPATDVELHPEKYGITKIYNEYDNYYQVSKDGTGGVVIDTKWLTREEFKELELDFREWLKGVPMKGKMQDYEMEMRK